MNNWYDDPAKVLQLARWMLTEGNRHMRFSDRAETVAFMLKNPRHYYNDWQKCQAILQPKEPSLSELARKDADAIRSLIFNMALRIEAFEAKAGE